jgi:hypothetical protein
MKRGDNLKNLAILTLEFINLSAANQSKNSPINKRKIAKTIV